ncbi:MAG TPA: DNA mismatch repair protein MutS [Spirochaetia bacterium]
MRFASILSDCPEADAFPTEGPEPDFFKDLNLDQILGVLTTGRDDYRLAPMFCAPVGDARTVEYRHEVLRDLESSGVMEPVRRFAEGMKEVRKHLALIEKLYYGHQKEWWLLDAVELYCASVHGLSESLDRLPLTSAGFVGLREYVSGYLGTEDFRHLEEEARSLKKSLGEVRYSVFVRENRVKVTRYDGEADFSAEVLRTFERFKQGDAKSYIVKLPDWPNMNHVEAQVLDLVARLYPEVFEALEAFCRDHGDFLDGILVRFDRESQFYVAYLELIAPLRAVGLRFCYPEVSSDSRDISADATFDLALAMKLVAAKVEVVTNEFHLDGVERIIVVTGPNQGGKTTFARTFGQLHYLASLGLLVPGGAARLFLPDRIFTHFEREEDLSNLRGKLEDELVRMHDVLDQATDRSIIVMNESFASTTLHDAFYIGSRILRRLIDLGLLGVYVTFVDELASMGPTVVSMVTTVAAENHVARTFKLVRRPADGLAYASAIAEKYGLTYGRLKQRVTR